MLNETRALVEVLQVLYITLILYSTQLLFYNYVMYFIAGYD